MHIVIKWSFLLLATCSGQQAEAQKKNGKLSAINQQVLATGQQDRAYWSDMLFKMASPVVFNLAAGTLKKNMPVEKAPGYGLNAQQVTYLEAVGRTMAGIAPWLALPDDDSREGQLRKQMRNAMIKGISNAVNPSNPDYLNF